MSRVCLAGLCLLACAFVVAAPPEADFYVSPAGRDTWSGKLASPNATHTDGPFATLDRARLAVRKMTGRAVTVLLRGGLYRLPATVVFTPDDSGSADRPITYAAYPGEKPILCGGRLIHGWRKGSGGLWTTTIPDVAEGRWYFHQLFINGRRATRARTPNHGYFLTQSPLPKPAGLAAKAANPDARIGFVFRGKDIKNWPDLADVNLFLYHSWTASMHWIASVDAAKHIVRFTNPCEWPVGYWEPTGQRYYLENYREALDEPGEWYLDRKTGVLTYWPLPGEDMKRAQVVAPVLQHLVEFKPNLKAGRFIDDLTFRGLAFEYAAWDRTKKEVTDGQAAVSLTAAIFAQGLRRSRFEDCEIAHVGEYALHLSDGCTDDAVSHCHIHDLGAGAVLIGMTYDPPAEANVCARNMVDNCFLHNGGNVFPAGVGVWIGRNSYNTVTHNEIRDFYYTGVSCGWSWGYAPSSANHNVIEYNDIHNIGCDVLSDLGGIYTLGISPGTRLCHNLIHNIFCWRFGAGGIYPDEGSSDLLIENNVIYNTSTGCFSQHYGQDNIVRNNILAFSRQAPCAVYRVEKHRSFYFDHNIVYSDTGQFFLANWSRAQHDDDYNDFWDTTHNEAPFDGMDLAEWRDLGHDRHSVVADPKFVDAAHFDFRLRPDSPALKLGFKPIDITSVGLYGDKAWTSLPGKYPARSYVEPHHKIVPPLRSINDGFEKTAVGKKPANATANEEAPGTIRVTDEAAASGKHSLKFTDAAGLQHAWMPHLVYSVPLRRGVAHLSFDCRLEAKAEFVIEARQWTSEPYLVGPSISLTAGGDLQANGKVVATNVPVGKWIHVDITFPLGMEAGKYDLAVKMPGHEAVKLTGLANGSPDFRTLTWVGFISNADAKTVEYLDNVKLHATK